METGAIHFNSVISLIAGLHLYEGSSCGTTVLTLDGQLSFLHAASTQVDLQIAGVYLFNKAMLHMELL